LFAGPDGEGAQIVREHGAGIVVQAEHPAKLASAIAFLADDAELRAKLAAASRAAAREFDREVLALTMLETLQRCAGAAPGAPDNKLGRRRSARRRA
jgi:glycosyltransferase involved in cell wall biosynthesis